MTTLVEFLLARIGEDEAVARAGWTRGAGMENLPQSWADEPTEELVAYTARFSPPRMLGECAVKRQVVEIAIGDWDPELVEDGVREHHGPSLIHAEDGEALWVDEWTTTRLLRTLAAPYANHIDYRDEWKP